MSINDQQTRFYGAVSSANATATGTVVSGKGQLRGVYVRNTGVAGTVTFRDGGSGGTVILILNTPAQVGISALPLPGAGIVFDTDLHVTLTSVDGVTVFYDNKA